MYIEHDSALWRNIFGTKYLIYLLINVFKKRGGLALTFFVLSSTPRSTVSTVIYSSFDGETH